MPFVPRVRTVPVCIAVICWFAVTAKAADEKPATSQPAGGTAAAPVDRYAVPEGDTAALLKFIEDLQNFRPAPEERLEYSTKVQEALRKAAEKIISLEKNPKSEAYQQAKGLLLQSRLEDLLTQNDDQAKTYQEIKDFLATKEKLTANDLGLAFYAASSLEKSLSEKLALDAYNTFGKRFSESKDELLASYGQKMLGSARRLDLPGKEMKIEGKTVDGKPFDWKSYRGKVVLVDYWATWCGPCVAELPNVKRYHELYKDKGFDVVGISLDSERETLVNFLDEQKLPWVCLFQDGAGWDHPAATYYGITAIPQAILVDKQGKVVKLEVRGEVLGEELRQLLGPVEEKPAPKDVRKTTEKAAG